MVITTTNKIQTEIKHVGGDLQVGHEPSQLEFGNYIFK